MSARLDVTTQPLALVDLGLASYYNGFGYDILSGLSLNSGGMFWGANEIWTPEIPGITTVWTIE